MGLSVRLEGELGDTAAQVNDPGNVLHRLLPSADDNASAVLRYIDWYGDTVFNRLQMKPFLDEWRALRDRARSDDERKLVDEVRALAERCRDDPHLYLRFVGD